MMWSRSATTCGIPAFWLKVSSWTPAGRSAPCRSSGTGRRTSRCDFRPSEGLRSHEVVIRAGLDKDIRVEAIIVRRVIVHLYVLAPCRSSVS